MLAFLFQVALMPPPGPMASSGTSGNARPPRSYLTPVVLSAVKEAFGMEESPSLPTAGGFTELGAELRDCLTLLPAGVVFKLVKKKLLQSARPLQLRLLREFVCTELARFLCISNFTSINPTEPFTAMGFDLPMSMQFRDCLASAVDYKLPTGILFNYPTVEVQTCF